MLHLKHLSPIVERSPTLGVRTLQSKQGDSLLSELTFVLNLTRHSKCSSRWAAIRQDKLHRFRPQHINIPVSAMHRNSHNPSPQHPYASGGFEYPRGDMTEDMYNQQQYSRASPMTSSAAPLAISPVHARAGAGDVGCSYG
jgi:hypothetical protein